MSTFRILVGITTLASALVVGSVSSPAEATITRGPCRITAIEPLPVVYHPATRKRTSGGRAEYSCTSPQTVQIEVQLWGEDPDQDDLLASGYFTGPAGPFVRTVANERVPCHEDAGTDELYSRARIRLTSGAWSGWRKVYDRGATYSFDC